MSKSKGRSNLFTVLDKTQNTCSDQYLLCCRSCLSTDGRLYNIHEYKLANAFSAIAGVPVIKDRLPQYLCSHCCTLLTKCVSFRKMCVRTQQRLMPELLTGQLNTDYIRSINKSSHRFINLTITEVETVDYMPENCKKNTGALTQDINLEATIAEGIKVEPNINIVDVNNILNNTDEIDIEINEERINVKDENALKSNKFIKINKDETRTKCKIEEESENGDVINDSRIKCDIVNTKEDMGDINLKNEPNVGIGYHVENKNDDSCTQIVENSVKKRKGNGTQNANDPVKKRIRNRDEKKTVNEKNTCQKPTFRRKRIKNEKEEMRKNKIFESDHLVRIVILSKDEQLAEVAARRGGRNYLESQFKCEECYKGYGMRPAYDNHMERHSASFGPYSCEICHVRFASEKRRNQHQGLHQMKMFCTLCDFVSRTKSQAMLHHALHAGRVYECQHCGKSFQKSTSYLSHVRNMHPAMNAACDECGEVFVGEHGLRLHKGKTHAKKIKCEVCSAMFVSVAALDRHTNTAGEHTDLRPCEQCGENCASEAALHQHVGESHPTVSIPCDECSISFPTAEAYSTHVERSHLEQKKKIDTQLRKYLRQEPFLKKEVMCELCGFKVPFPSMLKQHNQLKHQAPKPYACNDCPKAFTSKENLIIHIRSHTGEKPYKCKRCPSAFSMKGNLVRHHKTVHQGVRGCFTCGICGSTVTTKHSLRVHIDSKHGGFGWPRSRKRQQKIKTK